MADTRLIPEALEWPLVGRDDELARIAELRALGGCPGVVHQRGRRRRQVEPRARRARRGEGATARSSAWVQATPSAAAVPLGAFAGADPRRRRAVGRAARADAAEAERLRERAGGRPVVLGVDDAQLLDPVSAALVLHLSLTGARSSS